MKLLPTKQKQLAMWSIPDVWLQDTPPLTDQKPAMEHLKRNGKHIHVTYTLTVSENMQGAGPCEISELSKPTLAEEEHLLSQREGMYSFVF